MNPERLDKLERVGFVITVIFASLVIAGNLLALMLKLCQS